MKNQFLSDEQIQKAIHQVLKEYRTVNSQTQLHELVLKQVKTKNIGTSVQRLRNIAINSDFATLEIHSREGDPNKIMSKCPVCTSDLNHVKNQTIWGGKVTIEFSCKHCGYWTGKKKRIPTRYVFHLKKKK